MDSESVTPVPKPPPKPMLNARPIFDWLLAQSLYLKGIPTREICRIIGCKPPALRQQRYRNGWEALKTKVAVIESQQNGQCQNPQAQPAQLCESIYAGDDIEVWSNRMRRKIMDRTEAMVNLVRDDDPKGFATLKDAADIVRKLQDRAPAVSGGDSAPVAVDFTRVRDVDQSPKANDA